MGWTGRPIPHSPPPGRPTDRLTVTDSIHPIPVCVCVCVGINGINQQELVELSQEDLLKLQENTTVALTKKCELDRYCSICLERMKDHVCVPCGHRYCGQCIAQVRPCLVLYIRGEARHMPGLYVCISMRPPIDMSPKKCRWIAAPSAGSGLRRRSSASNNRRAGVRKAGEATAAAHTRPARRQRDVHGEGFS